MLKEIELLYNLMVILIFDELFAHSTYFANKYKLTIGFIQKVLIKLFYSYSLYRLS